MSVAVMRWLSNDEYEKIYRRVYCSREYRESSDKAKDNLFRRFVNDDINAKRARIGLCGVDEMRSRDDHPHH